MMEEIKVRLRVARSHLHAADKHREDADAYLYAEFCYLQIRRITELIALATLVAHNQIQDFRSDKFVKNWKADAIFSMLGKLSGKGFPAPIEWEAHDDDRGNVVIHTRGFLAKSDLAKIYQDCGDRLHAGSLKHIFRKGRKMYNLAEIERWGNDLVALLNQHIVRMPEMKTVLLVSMSHPAAGGGVFCEMSEPSGEGLFRPILQSHHPQ